MHHLKIGDTSFNFNSDLSGLVEITRPYIESKKFCPPGHTSLCIPGSTLIEFVAEHARNKKITVLEHASDESVLGIPEPTKS